MICQQIEHDNCLCCMILTKIQFNEPELRKKSESTVHLLCTAPMNVMMKLFHVVQHRGEC